MFLTCAWQNIAVQFGACNTRKKTNTLLPTKQVLLTSTTTALRCNFGRRHTKAQVLSLLGVACQVCNSSAYTETLQHSLVQRAHPRELAQAQLISRTVRRHFATNLHVRSPLVDSAQH